MLKLSFAARLVLLALILSTPALAQSSTEEAPPVEAVETQPDVDPALVGAWELDELTAPGVLAAYGVDVQTMTCLFTSAGEAEIAMLAIQDGDPISRTRSFSFRTEGGEILEEGDTPVSYRILEDGSLEITDDEMVIRFVRP